MKINKKKQIGRVLFIVEGSRYEFNLLRKIFCDVLHYDYIEKRRNRPGVFVSRHDRYSEVAVVNTRESNISDISNHRDYLDRVFDLLREKYQFPIDKSAVYYLFDRDPKSNTDKERIKEYIGVLKNPYENENALGAGQLLLSYPSIESYMISGFREHSYELYMGLGANAKKFISRNADIQFNQISEHTLLRATEEFIAFLSMEGIEWEIDDFAEANREIYEKQEAEYMNRSAFRVFSMLSLAFLQLGVIEL